MRIRQIKPSWWLDKDLRRNLPAEAREFYIGLWMIADDAGWFEWDVERIAAELYPYDTVSRRERNVANWSRLLRDLHPTAPHLRVFECGHAVVPKMAGHQRIAGKQTFSARDKHRFCAPLDAGEPNSATDSHGTVGNGMGSRNGTERNGSGSAREARPGEPGGLKDRLGSLDEILGGRAS